MGNKFDSMILSMIANMDTVKGETYNFVNNDKKKSAAQARKALLNIVKVAKDMRKELQDVKKALPVHRRQISDEVKAKMASARAAKRAEKAKKA